MTLTILEKPILKKTQPKTCEICGDVLSRQQQKFCSKICHDKSMRKQVEITCKFCGKVFTIKQSRSESRKYCSTKCMSSDPQWREANSKRLKQEGVKIVCELCGDVFVVNKAKAKIRTHCSQKCRNADPKWRKKLSQARIKYFAEKKYENVLAGKMAIQRINDMPKIVIMPNVCADGWHNNLLALIEGLNNSLPETIIEKMSYIHESVVIVPRDHSYEQCKSVVEKHTNNIDHDGQKYFVVMEI